MPSINPTPCPPSDILPIIWMRCSLFNVDSSSLGTEPFSQMYEELVADALDQASPSHDTASQHA
ncbi:hypothetical protein PCASD_09459 [Puccinia coronata f. sp. avenae]|uniref:Uncharacterized protein n=1 Tax=Puccinia coronata f. sp. avenae TaxID=200324 RepID=A0A2N5SZE1_9BASI|nr:hypothetical protein PCASD_23480 [Puccinia coronata f. sp. avenae]PLW38196.1 hypothetical protein PCASD_09459 [Puccinia coronata f. sp. avenae]